MWSQCNHIYSYPLLPQNASVQLVSITRTHPSLMLCFSKKHYFGDGSRDMRILKKECGIFYPQAVPNAEVSSLLQRQQLDLYNSRCCGVTGKHAKHKILEI